MSVTAGLRFASLLVVVTLPSAYAQTPPVPLAATRLTAPPVIDGKLGDEWRSAPPSPLTFQTQPGDNAAPSERTEFRLGYDDTHLYLAIRAWDSDPSAIRGRVTRRDDIFADDYVTVHLDTYDDRRRAYVFSFNPLGIQGDGLYNEGVSTGRNFDGNIDRTWDGVLTSKGLVVEDGYIIEVAIPFNSLRYQLGADRSWGLHVQRWIARKAESISWRPISREVPSLLTQMGALSGISDVGRGPSIDVIPTLTTAISADRQLDGSLANTTDYEPGITGSWAMTPNVTLSATANPDFSQIEADVPQIEVNQRFPLRYAEKRPFFLEGGQFFRSPGALNFVETRQIVDPDWGAKLTAKSGRNTYALLVAADAAPGLTVPTNHPNYGQAAQVAIGRYQRDILQNSTVGAFVTTRHFADRDNTVIAVDGQLRLPRQTVGYQGSLSFTDDAQGQATGDATYVWYDFVGRHWRVFVNDQRISGDYRADLAFVRRTGFKMNSTNIGYEFQGANTWWVRARPFIVARALRLPDGTLDESYADPGVDVTFARDVTLYAYRSWHRNSFLGREVQPAVHVVEQHGQHLQTPCAERPRRRGRGRALRSGQPAGGTLARSQPDRDPQAGCTAQLRDAVSEEPPAGTRHQPRVVQPGHRPQSHELPVHARACGSIDRRIQHAVAPNQRQPALYVSAAAQHIDPCWLRRCAVRRSRSADPRAGRRMAAAAAHSVREAVAQFPPIGADRPLMGSSDRSWAVAAPRGRRPLQLGTTSCRPTCCTLSAISPGRRSISCCW